MRQKCLLVVANDDERRLDGGEESKSSLAEKGNRSPCRDSHSLRSVLRDRDGPLILQDTRFPLAALLSLSVEATLPARTACVAHAERDICIAPTTTAPRRRTRSA